MTDHDKSSSSTTNTAIKKETTMESSGDEEEEEEKDKNKKSSSENELASDSSESDDEEHNELDYLTRELSADEFYSKQSNGNRQATHQALLISKTFHERVYKHVMKAKNEQTISIPNPYLIGPAPPPKIPKSKKKQQKEKEKDENAPSAAKRPRRYNSARHQQLEIERKRNHPASLSKDLIFNEPKQQNDGPFCKCYEDCRDTGVIHQIFPGEEEPIPFCDLYSNNSTKLHHYVVEIRPDFPLKHRQRSVIHHEQKTYTFTGFSLFFHKQVDENLPKRWLNRMFPEYSVRLFKAPMIENFCVYELELFFEYFFKQILELSDINRGCEMKATCPFYHLMPRFALIDEAEGAPKTHNLLPMIYVLDHLISNFTSLASNPKGSVSRARRWLKNQLVICPTKKPSCIRVDDLIDQKHQGLHLVHQTQRPTSQLSFARQQFFVAQRRYQTLTAKLKAEKGLSDVDTKAMTDAFDEMEKYKNEKHQRPDNKLEFPMRQFHSTGLYADLTQHALFALTVCWRVRYHWSLHAFEQNLQYKFENRLLLELALTHPSNLTNYGTNSDHARNTLRNCGLRDIRDKRKARKSHIFERRKGISTLMKIMSKFGSKEERQSSLHHNERLEFLGDAIVELLTSHHLFYMMPYAEEGVLASHRSKLVRNANLGQVGRRLEINKFLLYSHGPDLSNYDGMTKAMANAFEALMAAIYLDSSIDECDRVLSQAFFKEVPDLLERWEEMNEHPLKRHSPSDRHWIEKVKWLQKLEELEQYTGIFFHHIRVMARAFTRRHIGYNNLTQGHNQRLEFLGDTVLQFFVSDYLYRHFPRHQEGHLSLLRSCLVSNRTQSVICDDLRLTHYLFDLRNAKDIEGALKALGLTMKDKADLLESYLGAIFVDRGFDFAEAFCRVCFFPRLHAFIRSSRWNDPKSQLQQCCLTLRRMNLTSPDIPEYRTVGVQGPTNTREFKVIVLFRNKRLASGIGHTIHAAEMNAAENALIRNAHLFENFNLNQTYLGIKIKEYDDKIEEDVKPTITTLPSTLEPSAISDDDDEDRMENGELAENNGIVVDKQAKIDDEEPKRKKLKKDKKKVKKPKELKPIKISSDEESDALSN